MVFKFTIKEDGKRDESTSIISDNICFFKTLDYPDRTGGTGYYYLKIFMNGGFSIDLTYTDIKERDAQERRLNDFFLLPAV